MRVFSFFFLVVLFLTLTGSFSLFISLRVKGFPMVRWCTCQSSESSSTLTSVNWKKARLVWLDMRMASGTQPKSKVRVILLCIFQCICEIIRLDHDFMCVAILLHGAGWVLIIPGTTFRMDKSLQASGKGPQLKRERDQKMGKCCFCFWL